MNSLRKIEKYFSILLSSKTKHRVENAILIVAIVSYVVHLSIIFLNVQGFLTLDEKFFTNPIAAIYTPFSFILIYEVYLLIYFLPKSITIYIGKQYEIITLIVIRRIFKDIAYVELTSDWFTDKNDLQFTFDVLTSVILFFLIFQFYKSTKRADYTLVEKQLEKDVNVSKFIRLKQTLATILVPILAILASYSLIKWGFSIFDNYANGITEFKKLNNVFFDEFFTVLIIVDVLLLLFSFFYSDQFHKIIRNSGFVISTILIKVSFLSEGIVNNVLIISAVIFGYLMLVIHNLYEKNSE